MILRVTMKFLKMEQFTLNSPVVTMLSATNEAHSSDFFARKDVQGGYFARTFIIHETEPNTVNSLMFPPKLATDYKKLSEYLRALAKLRGEFTMDMESRHYFNDWYRDFRTSIKQQELKDSTGTLNRFDESVLKVAMLISLGHAPELVITKDAVTEAIDQCEKLIGNVRKATMGSGKSSSAQEKAIVINELLERDPHVISRQQLNKKYWGRATSEEWDEIMKSLHVAGIVEIDTVGNTIIYRMSNERVEELRRHLRGK